MSSSLSFHSSQGIHASFHWVWILVGCFQCCQRAWRVKYAPRYFFALPMSLGNIRVFPGPPHHSASAVAFRFFRYINISLPPAGNPLALQPPTTSPRISLSLSFPFLLCSFPSSSSIFSSFLFLQRCILLPLLPTWVAMAIRTWTAKLCFHHISSMFSLSLIHYSFIAVTTP